MTVRPLVLASSSPYRRALLTRLGLSFETASPDIDEQPRAGEAAEDLAERLARAKAQALAERFPDHWIIGSDQVAALPDGSGLSKPGNHESACQQLAQSSNRTVTFHTGLALMDSATGTITSLCEPYRVRFRHLSERDIEHYLRTETPYDCAGSFRMEGLGITLFSALEGRDPNTLVGLPLMALIDLLGDWGLDVLAAAYRNSSRD